MSITDEVREGIGPIFVKVFDMGVHSKDYWVVRGATLTWAEEEVLKFLKSKGARFPNGEMPPIFYESGYSKTPETVQQDMLNYFKELEI